MLRLHDCCKLWSFRRSSINANICDLNLDLMDDVSCTCTFEIYGLQVSEVYKKIRLTLRYMLGNAFPCLPVEHKDLPRIDKYILGRFAILMDEVQAGYQSYSFHRIYQVQMRQTIGNNATPDNAIACKPFAITPVRTDQTQAASDMLLLSVLMMSA